MHFDDYSVSAGRDGRKRHRAYLVADAERVAGVNDYRKVGKAAQNRNGAKVKRVAGGALVGSDSALAKDYVLAAA